MKKIILASVISVSFLFSFDKSFAKHCGATFNVGGAIYQPFFFTQTISVDTFFTAGTNINLPVTVTAGGGDIYCHCTNDGITWFHNNTLISDSSAFNIADTGIYIVNILEDTAHTCSKSYNFQMTLHVGYSIATSVDEISNANILQIYPNPTNNTFTINNISSIETSLLQIINPIGEVVYTEKFFRKNEQIVISNFVKGVYFVLMSGGEMNIMRKLVIE